MDKTWAKCKQPLLCVKFQWLFKIMGTFQRKYIFMTPWINVFKVVQIENQGQGSANWLRTK